MDEQVPRQWLILAYKVPSEPTRIRTSVWRQVKALGCFHLQQAVWLLPKTVQTEAELQKLSASIEEMGGEASLLSTSSQNAAWEERTIAGFNRARDEEYAEVIENEERFEDEIRRETRKEKFTFAEMEDMEADWEKLNRWHQRVVARDFFGAPGRQEAETRLMEGERMLVEFNRRVYEHEGVEKSLEEEKEVE
ncbi:MAG TPA: Chromate resistance protein ChrB [Chloroflexota bacterium]|nr:Chromate resistance protein ChrB [Chloroflexota bacterium]